MMETNNNKDTWFEWVLRSDPGSAAIDFNAVEKRLFEHISQTESLGILSLLKIDEVVSIDRFQHLEKELFSQITQFKEYEEPVNECINADQELTSSQWERLETKLFSKIKDSVALPLWEQLLMTPEVEPLPGNWEQIENRITEEITQSDKQESWVLCARKEEVSVPATIEKEEQLFEEIFAEQEQLSWEKNLQREVVLSIDQLDKIEESILSRIERENKQSELAKQPFWNFINHYITVLKTAGVVTALILISIGGIAGFHSYTKSIAPVPTVAYQVNGEALNIPGISEKVNQSFSSVVGGAVRLINRHGTIELRNNSKVWFSKVTEKVAHYQVSFSDADPGNTSRGRVTFLVNRHKPNEEFKIHTSDYQIMVKGTYFQMEPGLGGSVTTRVLEGVIRISSKDFGETELSAGQIFEYNPATEQYTVKDGGQVVQRKDIEPVPDMDSLMNHKLLQLNTNVTDARVYIDGKLYGSAPVAILYQPGKCSVRISKDGYVTLDTVLTINGEEQDLKVIAVLEKVAKPVSVKKEVKYRRTLISEKPKVVQSEPMVEPVVTPEQISSKFLEPDNEEQHKNGELYLMAQKEELDGNWQKAIELYQMVFDNQNASRLRREDALFSIGRLKADNVYNPSEACQVFLTYIALFPSGSFAGESWLRLAELEFRNKPENATQYYEKFFQMFPQHPRIVELKNRVGAIYLQQKRFDEAIDMFRQALNSSVSPRDNERKIISANLDRALQEKMHSNNSLVNQ